MLAFLQAKITKRYLLITLIVILFTLSSVYLLTIQVLNSSVREQIEQRDDLIARTLSKRIGSIVKKMVDDMRVVSSYVVRTSLEDPLFYVSEMQRMVVQDPLYLYIQVFDKEKKLSVRVPDVPLFNPAEIDQIQNRISWSKTYYISNLINLPDGRKTIAIASPVLHENGEFLGSSIAYINLNTFSEYLRELKIGKEGVNAILDSTGTIIAHSNLDNISVSLKNHPLGSFLYKEKYGLWEGELFGQQMLVAYRPLTAALGLIVGEPVQQSLEPSHHVMVVLLQGFLVVLLIAIGLSFYSTGKLVRPVLDLTTQVREYKENRRRNFRPLQTRDELQDLSIVMGQMARDLTEKERRMFYILESIPYGVITTDKNGKITTFNKGAEELTLFSREEAIGKKIIDLPLKDNTEEFISWKTLKEGKEFNEIESYLYDKRRGKHDVRIYSSLFPGEENEIVGAITVIRDVSEIKKLEEYAKQSERLASLGQLTAGIAHEIKNPLSIIQAAAEAVQLELREKQPNHQLVEELTVDILDSSDRMNKLLSDFLKLSKDESEEPKTAVNIVQLLNELLHLLRNKWNERGISVHRYYEVTTALVYADKNRLTQVYLNILLNGLEAMDRGGALSVYVKDCPPYWETIIEDTGKGIPSTKLPWIFNPFFSTKHEGTGLGLSIAHEIIQQHGGNIYAESIEGEGTKLFIQVPKAEEECK